MARLKDVFREQVRTALQKQFELNAMQVPTVEKIVINMGVGDAVGDSKALDAAMKELAVISGQKPVITRAKKSIAAFKIRDGMAIGCKVTLRGERMWHFLDKLINISLPRIRDFRGLSPSAFDGRGNYALGVREQLIFPEIRYDEVNAMRGMDIIIVTSAKNDEQAYALLAALGMPFRTAA